VGIEESQTLIAISIGLLFVIGIQILGKRGKLSFRYTIGWMLLGCIGVVSGALIPVAGSLTDIIPLSPSAFVAAVGVLILTVIAVQLSISISGIQEQLRCLAEEVAFLKSANETVEDVEI
jgi:hypothetical protein